MHEYPLIQQIVEENFKAAKSHFISGENTAPELAPRKELTGTIILGGHGKPAPEKFYHCKRCGLLLTAESLTKGRCAMCRADLCVNAVLVGIILSIIVLLLAACTGSEGETTTQSTEWKRCVKNGDWLETPYCDAVSRGDGNA